MSAPAEPGRANKPRRQPQRQPQQHYRRTSAIVSERPDGKPIIFGYGRHMTLKEKERAKKLIAYIALGIVLAISAIVIAWAAIYDNFIYPNQSVASVNGHGISRHDRDVMTNYYNAQAQQASAQGGQLQGDPAALAMQQLQQDLLTKLAAQQKLGVTATLAEAQAKLTKDVGSNVANFNSALKAYNVSKDDYLRLIEEPQVLDQKVGVYLTRGNPKVADQWHYARLEVKDQKTANSVLQQLLGGANFATLAKKVSIDSQTKSKGGDMGWARVVDSSDPLLATTFLKPLQSMAASHATYKVVKDGPSAWYVIEFLGHDAKHPLSSTQMQQDQVSAFNTWFTKLKQTAVFDPPLASPTPSTGTTVQQPSSGQPGASTPTGQQSGSQKK